MAKKKSNQKPFGFGNTNRRFNHLARSQGEVAKDRFAFDQAMQGHDCTKIRRGGDFLVQKRDFFGSQIGERVVFEVKTGNSRVTEAQEQRRRLLGRNRYRLVRY